MSERVHRAGCACDRYCQALSLGFEVPLRAHVARLTGRLWWNQRDPPPTEQPRIVRGRAGGPRSAERLPSGDDVAQRTARERSSLAAPLGAERATSPTAGISLDRVSGET